LKIDQPSSDYGSTRNVKCKIKCVKNNTDQGKNEEGNYKKLNIGVCIFKKGHKC